MEPGGGGLWVEGKGRADAAVEHESEWKGIDGLMLSQKKSPSRTVRHSPTGFRDFWSLSLRSYKSFDGRGELE